MAEVLIRGWCPSALRPMMSGDGLVLRVAPPLARLTPAQGRGLAQAARRHGNGVIDLTARGNVQLRGVGDRHAALLAELTALGLIPKAEVNLTISPFWQAGDGTEDVAAALIAVLGDGPRMPGKFGYAVDLGGVLGGVSADVRIERHSQGYLVRPDSFDCGATVATAEQAACAARVLAEWFLASGAVRQGRGRMTGLWAGEPAPLREARLPAAFRADRAVRRAEIAPEPGPHPMGFLVGFEFGQLSADLLEALSAGSLRIPPWRMVLLEGAEAAPDLPGLITEPNDARRRVTACTGAPGCLQGLQPTRPLARRLAASVPPGRHLHVSGCAKGCAHPGPADVTLTATAAGYDMIRNGRAGDAGSSYDPSKPLFKAL